MFCLHFLPDLRQIWTFKFLKAVRQHTREVIHGFCIGNSALFPVVKEFGKSVEIWRSYRHEFGGSLFGTRCSCIACRCVRVSAIHDGWLGRVLHYDVKSNQTHASLYLYLYIQYVALSMSTCRPASPLAFLRMCSSLSTSYCCCCCCCCSAAGGRCSTDAQWQSPRWYHLDFFASEASLALLFHVDCAS